jgi:dienelactone hydrolase
MKEKLHKRNGFWLVLSLVLVLISAVGASLVQTDGGTVKVKEMYWETSTGVGLSALLFKPDSATAENQAPAIVVSHGRYNNKEMQEGNFVELARRGYVVISIDMYGHGDSDYTKIDTNTVGGTGMYDAVKLLADLPYVDADRIGVTGHSAGGFAVNYSVAIDNAADEQLIAAALLVSADPTYTDPDGVYIDAFGERDAGVIAGQYDEFFFRVNGPTGPSNAPRDYIGTPNAQSFLHYGIDPAEAEDVREADTVYTDGSGMRVVYTPAEIHPWAHFSAESVGYAVEFFEEALGAPEPIAPGSQAWQFREFFTALGLVGFGIFLVAFTRALLVTRPFAALAAEQAPQILPATRKGLAWFWGGVVASVIISAVSFVLVTVNPTVSGIGFFGAPPLHPQGPPFFIGVWAALNGIAGLIILAITYNAFGKKNGQTFRAAGVLPGWRKLFHTLGLAAVVVASAYALVFVVDYFFTTDFRLWVLAIRAFEPDKLLIALPYLPFFLLYFVVNSILLNGFSRITLAGKEWLNTAVLAVANSLGPVIIIVIQYVTFWSTGLPVGGLGPFSAMYVIWLFPVVVILAAAAVISRKIYRATGNPWLAGFINAAVVTLIAVSNSLTMA